MTDTETEHVGTALMHEKIAIAVKRYPQTQGWVGKQIGMDASQISRVVSGKQGITLAQLIRLADVVGASIDWLTDDEAGPEFVPRRGVSADKVTPDEAIILRVVRAARLSVDDVIAAIDARPRATQEGASRPAQALKPVGREAFEGPAEPPRKDKDKGKDKDKP